MIRGETPSDLVFFLLLVSINSCTCWQCTVKSAYKNNRYLSSKKRKRFLIFAVMKLVLKRIEEDTNCWAAFHVNLAYIPSIRLETIEQYVNTQLLSAAFQIS